MNLRFKVLTLGAAAACFVRVPLRAADPAAATGAPATGATTVESRPSNYELSPGDTIAISVFREPDLSIQQHISRDGTINFPLLGVVRLGGKNTNDAAALIAGLLSKGYLVHPQVSVSVVEYDKVKFTILGQVNRPGAFEIPADQSIDLLSAIALAGGFTRIANSSNVLVRRTTNGQEETLKIDAKRLISDRKSKRFVIRPNDTISVGESIF